MSEIFVKKANGEEEIFDPEKLRSSLARTGADTSVVEDIISHIEAELRPGLTTHTIYKHAFDVLKRINNDLAAKYSLRRALLSFGPTGFPFERYLSELFKKDGYESVTGQVLQGKCVSHEVDVVAHKENELVFAEAKFHNRHGFKSDVRTALYMKARFDDLESQDFSFSNSQKRPTKCMIITNTKFTHEAIAYAECVGLRLLSWSYPGVGNLQDWIERTGLHPITCLTTLSQKDKEALIAHDVVLCSSVQQSEEALRGIGLTNEKTQAVMEEAGRVCTLPLPKS